MAAASVCGRVSPEKAPCCGPSLPGPPRPESRPASWTLELAERLLQKPSGVPLPRPSLGLSWELASPPWTWGRGDPAWTPPAAQRAGSEPYRCKVVVRLHGAPLQAGDHACRRRAAASWVGGWVMAASWRPLSSAGSRRAPLLHADFGARSPELQPVPREPCPESMRTFPPLRLPTGQGTAAAGGRGPHRILTPASSRP